MWCKLPLKWNFVNHNNLGSKDWNNSKSKIVYFLFIKLFCLFEVNKMKKN